MRLKDKKTKIDLSKEKEFKPTRLVFNFSFITKDKKYNFKGKGFNSQVKTKLLERLFFLSSSDYDVVLALPKEVGLERLDDNLPRFSIHPEFLSSRMDYCLDGIWVFRLNKLGRVLGKINNHTFYILCVDTTFDTYDH